MILLGMTLVLTAATAVVFFTNIWVWEAVGRLPHQANYLVNTTQSYATGVRAQTHTLHSFYKNTSDQIKTDISNTGSVVLKLAIENFEEKLRSPLEELDNLAGNLTKLVGETGECKTENLLCVLENTIVSLHNNTTKMFREIESVKTDMETVLNSSELCLTPLSSCGMLRMGLQELKYQDSYGFVEVSI